MAEEAKDKTPTTYIVLRQISDSTYMEIGREVASSRKAAVGLALASRDTPEVGTNEVYKAVPVGSWKSVVADMERPAPRLRLFESDEDAAPAPAAVDEGEFVNDPAKRDQGGTAGAGASRPGTTLA